MPPKVFDLAVAGHFSLDSINLPNFQKPSAVLGGSVAYFSLIARKLGATVSVISKVGSDFPQTYLKSLQAEGVDLSNIMRSKNDITTSFELSYSEDLSSRTLCLRHKGSPLELTDLPKSLRAKAIHIAPIAGEISYEVVEELKAYANCLSIDPQGMTRRFDENGKVGCCAQLNNHLLSLINIYKSSLDEIVVLTGQLDLNKAISAIHDLGPEVVMVTMGSKGSVLSNQGVIYEVPVFKSGRVVDPTGAGDVFIGAFLAEYVRQKETMWSASVGSAAASLVVEGVGASFLGEEEEIYRRAKVVYEKEIKQ